MHIYIKERYLKIEKRLGLDLLRDEKRPKLQRKVPKEVQEKETSDLVQQTTRNQKSPKQKMNFHINHRRISNSFPSYGPQQGM